MAPPRRIAMWSGPRNISTAMMRSWGSRADTAVIDEPFYAYYLQQTGRTDPLAEDIIDSQPTEWSRVVEALSTGAPDNAPIFYQKHITSHLLESIPLDWLAQLSHCFLIRDPDRVIASYLKKKPDAVATDFGFKQQYRIFEYVVQKLGHEPIVIDTDRFLKNPAGQLTVVCQKLGIDFDESMLSWESGPRVTDGIWESHWYDAVKQSTGFMPFNPVDVNQTAEARDMANQCRPHYEKMRIHAIATDAD